MKIIFMLLLFISVPAFADNIINHNTVCNAIDLYTVNNVSNLIPVFIPNTYNCNSGYFLPANTDGCRPCPDGYTCNGGTFSFNERQAQGIKPKSIITSTTQYICSSDLVNSANNISNMVPIFIPNTVTLNFDNGNGTNASTTCAYDGLVNLPPTPTRPGYIFNGWKLITNE